MTTAIQVNDLHYTYEGQDGGETHIVFDGLSLSSRYPHKTLAPHPQPEPPACTSCFFVSKMRSPQSL